MRHILFGDSIGFGVGDFQNGGWATQLRLFIDRQKQAKDHNLINLSISGDTTRNLLDRMEREAKLRMRQDPPDAFTYLIAIGANDSKRDKSNPEDDISAVEYEKNVRHILEVAEKLSKEVVLIGLIPVDEKRTTPYKENKHYLVGVLEEYNSILLKIAQEKGLRFVNFFPDWKQMNLPELFSDGLHPNTRGHQIMFETIKKELFESEQ